MRKTVLLTAIAVLFATVAMGGQTSFSGGVGGWFEWVEGERGFAMSSIPLGIRYTPDVVDNSELKRGYLPTPGVSRLSFSVQHIVRDGANDLSLIGSSYALWQFLDLGIEICPEVSAVIKYMGSDRALLGCYTGVRVPFDAGNSYEIRCGGFYDGEAAGAQVALAFLTE